MKKPTLIIAFAMLALQSCKKEYTCVCDSPGVVGDAYRIGTVRATGKEKADQLCLKMGNYGVCWAMQFE